MGSYNEHEMHDLRKRLRNLEESFQLHNVKNASSKVNRFISYINDNDFSFSTVLEEFDNFEKQALKDAEFENMGFIKKFHVSILQPILKNLSTDGGSGDGSNNPPNNLGKNMKNFISKKAIGWTAGIVGSIILIFSIIDINQAGNRTVVQHLSGKLETVFDPGPYLKLFGTKTVYKDVITMDFDRSENAEGTTLDQMGINVRYQDGGTGSIFGIARFALPNVHEQMVKIHKELRSNNGIAYKVIKPYTEEISNHTAGLMTSEESYDERRGEFTQLIKRQLGKGKLATVQKEITTVENGMEFCLGSKLTKVQKKECKDVRKTRKMIPVIKQVDGIDVHLVSDLDQYGIRLVGFTQSDWDYEQKTITQISDKREATMAINISKANAERAKQDAITAEQQGLANVKTAQYKEEVEKIKKVVIAERAAEVAVIKAKQTVDVAEQLKLEQEQLKLAAYEEKKKLIAKGQGEAEKKRLIFEADGALSLRLEAAVQMNKDAWNAASKVKTWTPQNQVTLGGSDGKGGSSTALENMMGIISANQALQLGLDKSLNMKK